MAADKEHALERVSNFRDVGQTVNAFLSKKLGPPSSPSSPDFAADKIVSSEWFEKDSYTDLPDRVSSIHLNTSSTLLDMLTALQISDNASPEDMVYLADNLGIRTVIDLRTNTELARQAAKRTALRLVDPSVPATARIPGIQYHEIKVTGRRFERHVASLLTWWQFFQFLFLYAWGYRDQAVRVVAENVLVPRGLLGIGRDKLDHSGVEIAAALRLYTQRQTTPVLVHCTQGKDRTGLICCLVLMVLGIPMAAIEHDYRLTDVGLAREREQLLKEVRAVGLTEAWAYTDRGMMSGIKRHLDERYGGLEAYLDGIGFDESERERMRDTLLI